MRIFGYGIHDSVLIIHPITVTFVLLLWITQNTIIWVTACVLLTALYDAFRSANGNFIYFQTVVYCCIASSFILVLEAKLNWTWNKKRILEFTLFCILYCHNYGELLDLSNRAFPRVTHVINNFLKNNFSTKRLNRLINFTFFQHNLMILLNYWKCIFILKKNKCVGGKK